MSASSQKARHYAALGGQLRKLNATMAETDALMGALGQHLECTRQFAVSHASMFMATSSLLDVEIEATAAQMDAERHAQAGAETTNNLASQSQSYASP